MKSNSYLLKNLSLLDKPEEEHSPENFPDEAQQENIKHFTALNIFWERLVTKPHSISQTPQASISGILEEELGVMASNLIKSILSEKLELPIDSPELSEAMENTCEIFHEDYPSDFILEYQGERLGMIFLDICYSSNNQGKPVYKFNPGLKSFQGLF